MPKGYAHVGGWTSLFDFPTTAGSWQPALGGPLTLQTDGFVARLSPNLQSAAWSTYVGGTLNDQFYDLELDTANGQVVVAGWSWSPNFPVTSLAYRTTNSGDMDAVVVRLAASGASPVFSTYLGGIDEDLAHAVSLANDGSARLTGWTRSSNYPLSLNAPQAVPGGDRDAIVSHLSAAGDQLLFSTRLGGPAADQGRGISAQGTEVMVVGEAGAGFPVTLDALQPTFASGVLDGFTSLFTNSGAALTYSSYAGGAATDVLDQVVLGSNGLAVMAGWLLSRRLPDHRGRPADPAPRGRGRCRAHARPVDGSRRRPHGRLARQPDVAVCSGRRTRAACRHGAQRDDVPGHGRRRARADRWPGRAGVHVQDLAVWLDDPALSGERDVLLGGPASIVGDDIETAIPLQGLTTSPTGMRLYASSPCSTPRRAGVRSRWPR